MEDKYFEYSTDDYTYKILEKTDNIKVRILNNLTDKIIFSRVFNRDLSITPEEFIEKLCFDEDYNGNLIWDIVVVIKVINRVIPNVDIKWAGEYYLSLLSNEKIYNTYFD